MAVGGGRMSQPCVVTSYGSGWMKNVVTLYRNQLWQWVKEGCRNLCRNQLWQWVKEGCRNAVS